MKTTLLLSTLALAASASIAWSQVVPDRYIAVFRDEVRDLPATANAMATQHGVAVDQVYQHALRGFAFAGPAQAAAALARRAEIAYVEQDQIFRANGVLPTGIDRADVDVALPSVAQGLGVSYAGSDVTVAVLDTGVDAGHDDLNVVGGIRYYGVISRGRLKVVSDDRFFDGNGHGTHVSGTIGARDDGVIFSGKHVVGVAPGIPIYAVKVLDDSGSGYTSAIIAGMDHVVANASLIQVANMSLGGGASQAMDDAVKRGTDAGVVFVVAAGNSGANVANYSPARAPSAITVSALADSDGQPGGIGPSFYSGGQLYTADDTLAPFSNYGAGVDVCAPGVLILSTVPGGGYDGSYSGTSMAAPHVAGAAALFIDRNFDGFSQQRNSVGVAAVASAIQTSGWQWNDAEYILSGDPDGIPEPLLNVAALMDTPLTLPEVKWVHCGDLNGTAAAAGRGWKATVTVTIEDASDGLVSGATVSGTWSGGYSGAVSGVTDGNGEVKFITGTINAKKTSVTFTVTGVTGTGLAYDPSANDVSTVTVTKP